MFVLFNIIIIGLVVLIAYWWGNQGLFSSVLHLLCVIVAGAIALAFWEPVTVGLVLRGTAFDPYAWGIVLVGLFVLSLLILRVAMDKLAPDNVDLPHAVNLGGGLIIGAAAATITMGIFMIGAGHLQAPRAIMGYNGVQRNERGEIGYINRMWFDVAAYTTDFYEFMSGTALWSPSPLSRVNPNLNAQATLLRDSYNNGAGQFSLAPKAARVEEAVRQDSRLRVSMAFDNAARDYNEQLTLSQSQVRLIDRNGMTVHPSGWQQESGQHEFETLTFYATSTPGQQTAKMSFQFNLPGGFDPVGGFIQVKGTRFPIERVTTGDVLAIGKQEVVDVELNPTSPTIDSAIQIDNGIRPIRISRNNLPPGIEEFGNLLTVGDAVFPGSATGVIRSNMALKGIYEPEGTRIVKVQVDQSSPANIFGQALIDRLPERAHIALIDTSGDVYNPIGYWHTRADRSIRIKLDPNNFVRERRDLPLIPSTGTEQLFLIFVVTEDRTIKGMKFGDETIGRCNVYVEPADA